MLLAVYGSLKQGYHNHIYLKGATYKGDFLTPPKWTMYSFGGFPGIVKGGDTQIMCEVYDIPEKLVSRINQLEGFTGVKDHKNNFYNRTTIDTPYGEAEIYFLDVEPIGLNIVQNGKW